MNYEIKIIKDEQTSMKDDIKSIKDDIKNIKDEQTIMKDDIKSIKDDINEIKSIIISIKEDMKKFVTKDDMEESLKKLEKRMNSKFSKLIDYNDWDDYCSEYHASYALEKFLIKSVPSYKIMEAKDKQIPRNIYYINETGAKIALTNLDGAVIGIPKGISSQYKNDNNNYNYNYHNSNFDNNYKLYILESKHKLTIKMVKKKILQIIDFLYLLNKDRIYGTTKFMTKLNKDSIYLFFSSPFIENNVIDFINQEHYLSPEYWNADADADNSLLQKSGYTMEDIQILKHKIGFVVNNGYDYSVKYAKFVF